MDLEKALSYLSLAKRAGQAASGSFQTEKALKEGKARLVIVSSDASENSRKHFSDMCAYRKVPLVIAADKETLGRNVGASERTVCAILSEGLAKAALTALDRE